jgi:PAS domain S-box-containing protein
MAFVRDWVIRILGQIEDVRALPVIGAIALALGIFIADLWTPLGLAVCALYLPVCLIALHCIGTREGLITGSFCTVLSITGLFLSPPGVPFSWAVINKTLILVALGFIILYGTLCNRRSDELKLAISAHRQTEELLRKSEERLHHAIRIAHVGIFEHAHESDTVYQSPILRKIFGFTADEPVNLQKYLQIVHPEDVAKVNLAVEQAHNPAGDGHYAIEHRIVSTDGSVRYVSLQSQTFFRGEGNNRKPSLTLGALIDITERKQLEDAQRESNSQLQQLSVHLLNVREDERTRIAREIHDELGAALTVVRMNMNHILSGQDKPVNTYQKELSQSISLLDATVENIRRIINELRPSILDTLGLWSAVEWLAMEVLQNTGVNCEIDIATSAEECIFNDEQTTGLFRIIQESLTNILKYARASVVIIHAYREDNNLVVEIRDDGIGIEDRNHTKIEGWGIMGMKERARQLQGQFYMLNNPNYKGVQITVSIPMG